MPDRTARRALEIAGIARIAVVFLALVLSAVPAHAAGFITPFLGYNFGGDSVDCIGLTSCREKRPNVGLLFDAASKSGGLEEDLSYAKNFFGPGDSNSVLTIMTNERLALPLGPIQPYVVIGIGLIRPHASYNPAQLITSKSDFGYDLGGGLTIMFGQSFGVRGDIRFFHTLQAVTLGIFNGAPLNFWRASVGLTFKD
jgi:opacity protein-like surface antigen